jgi:hypothetical protein
MQMTGRARQLLTLKFISDQDLCALRNGAVLLPPVVLRGVAQLTVICTARIRIRSWPEKRPAKFWTTARGPYFLHSEIIMDEVGFHPAAQQHDTVC